MTVDDFDGRWGVVPAVNVVATVAVAFVATTDEKVELGVYGLFSSCRFLNSSKFLNFSRPRLVNLTFVGSGILVVDVMYVCGGSTVGSYLRILGLRLNLPSTPSYNQPLRLVSGDQI